MALPEPSRPLSGLSNATRSLGAAFQRLSPREQRAVSLAAWVLGLGLLWWVALAPAIATLRQAGDRHAQLDRSLGQMQELAARAEVIRSQNAAPAPAREVALKALEDATRSLGAGAQLSLQGDQAQITLREVPAPALAQWLQQVRVNARLLPVQAQMQRSDNGATWSGQVLLAGPGPGNGRLMAAHQPLRWAWIGATAGLLTALLVFAPARWLGSLLHQLSGGKVQLVNARGTVWNGHGDLLLSGGEGSRGQTALPQGMRWRSDRAGRKARCCARP
jgi:general secretion pathway protein M